MDLKRIKSKPKIVGYFNLAKSFSKSLPDISHLENTLILENDSIASSYPFTKTQGNSVFIIGRILSILSIDYQLSDYDNKIEELIVILYGKYGPDFYSLLDGSFLIFLYDWGKKEFWIFNNRYQATSLYYYLDDNIFIFANSLKLLLGAVSPKPVFDKKSIPSFLNTGFSWTEKTQFKNVFRLLPTYRIQIKERKIDFTHHWDKEFVFKRKTFRNIETKLNEYERLFSGSIKNFLEQYNSKELGCLLSGGHDTSFVFIQAAKLFKKPIHTFTASFRNFGFDESPKAKYLSDMFGGIHHKIVIENKHLDLIPQMVNVIEEPLPGGSFPIFVCCLEASKYVDSLLTGDGGDSLWGEYYPVAEWHKYLKYVPYLGRKVIHSMSKMVLKFNDWERFWESEHVFSLFAKKDMYDLFFSRLCSYRHFNGELLKKFLNSHIFKNKSVNKCMVGVKFNRNNFFDALVEAKMFYGLYQYMIPPTQKSLEYLGVNFFPPYLNYKIINFINSLPENWLNGGISFKKLINHAHKRKFHKMALLRYLPERYVYSAQQSLDVPFHSFLNIRPAILGNLLKRLKRRGWFNNKTLDDVFNEFLRQKPKPHEIVELKHHGYRIFCLLTLEVWCMEFLDKDLKRKGAIEENIPLEDYLSL